MEMEMEREKLQAQCSTRAICSGTHKLAVEVGDAFRIKPSPSTKCFLVGSNLRRKNLFGTVGL